jgi:UDP-N-acetylmuramoyl-tripeptide--D-alanyl-D-alanine ligase
MLSIVQLKKINPIVVGIGGASGKSSLSLILSTVLSSKYKVKQSRGKNSETGIPLDILGINAGNYTIWDWFRILFESPLKLLTNWEKYDIYVAEMGIDSPKEPKNMSYLLKIVKPQIAALTNIAFEHSVYFDGLVKSPDGKKREEEILSLTKDQEMLLLKSLPKTGLAVVNLDDPIIEKESPTIAARKSTISIEKKDADFYAGSIEVDLDKFSFDVVYLGEIYKFKINRPLPSHYARSFLCALSIASYLQIPLHDSIANIQNSFSLPPGRLSVFEGVKNTTIIDSSYNNATLPPIIDILDLLKEISGKRRKVAILGDMRELGSISKKIHNEVAKKILLTCDFVILIGPLMNKYVAPVLEKNKFKYLSFKTFTAAKNSISKNIKEEDVILVKSSQNTLFLERAVEMLLKNRNDKDLLCRRGEFWDIQRVKTL